MADSFGVRMGLEGEREFKKALNEINQSFKVLGSEMNLVTSQFDKNEKSIESLSAANEVLNKEIDTQKDKIETLRKALDNASTSFGQNDKRTQSWQVQLNNAQADLNKLEKELKENNTALENTAEEMNDAEREAKHFDDALEESAKTASNASDKFSRLRSVVGGIGKALGTTMMAVGTAAIGAAASLTKMTVDAAANADDILTTATVTGMTTDALQAYSYAANLVDVSLETMTGSMAKNIKSMSNAAQGSKKYAAAYAKLGVSVTDANGQLRNSEDVYWETIDALGKVSNETERDALAMQLFGKSAQELNPLIAQGSKGIAELTKEAKAMGAVMSEDTLKKLGAFDDSMQRLKQGAGAAKNMLGTVLLPQLQMLADDVVSHLGEFTSGLQEANGDWSKISDVIGNTIGSLTTKLVDYLPDFVELGMDIIGSIGKALLDNLPTIIDAAISIVITLLQGIIDALPKVTDGALQLILALLQGIIDNLPALVKGAVQMVAALVTGIGEALPELIPAIIEAIILIVDTLVNNADKLLEAAFAIITGLAQGLINALPKLIEALPQLITSIITFITNNLPEIIAMGIELTVQLAAGLIQAIPQLVAAIPQIITAIIFGLGKAAEPIGETGMNIVKGLWDGICSMASWINEKVSGFVGGLVDDVKGVLGIHSPSTVFSGIGDNMAKGLGNGFEEQMRKVSDDINTAIPTDFETNANIRTSAGNKVIKSIIEHTGIIRVEGVQNSGDLSSVVDIIINQLRQEVRV